MTPDADGRIEIHVPPDICEDVNEILNVASTTLVFKYDVVAPTVTLESMVVAPNFSIFYTNVSPVPFQLNFSEAVTSFVDTDITVAGGAVSVFTGPSARSPSR